MRFSLFEIGLVSLQHISEYPVLTWVVVQFAQTISGEYFLSADEATSVRDILIEAGVRRCILCIQCRRDETVATPECSIKPERMLFESVEQSLSHI